jgi:heme oxygenase
LIDVTADNPAAPTTAPVAAVLQQLRDATGAAHRSLEDRLPFMRPELDQAMYVSLIEAYYGFYQPLERLLAQIDDTGVNGSERQKLPALRRDLQALGLSVAQIDSLPRCEHLPVIDNTDQLLGARYVIEGATLGGQVLRRVIKDKLAIEADSGAEFLDVYGRSTGPLWKAYLKQLASSDDPHHNPIVVEAAVSTFTCFERWLEQCGVLKSHPL